MTFADITRILAPKEQKNDIPGEKMAAILKNPDSVRARKNRFAELCKDSDTIKKTI